jgi:hypothetical protein
VNAVESLVGAQPIKDRLNTAAITLLVLKPVDFPAGAQRELYEEIHVNLTKVTGDPESGHIAASIRAMDGASAVEVAESIVRLLHVALLDD